ncbi:MAG TPA: PDZ domain-containing protein [Bryobacteraceae bacterium]|nr:PDZ domain-containing protein [Bryobacteraceae bacterium]
MCDTKEFTRAYEGLLRLARGLELYRSEMLGSFTVGHLRGDSQLHAPLGQPGLKLSKGDYILAVNGEELKPDDNIQQFLEETGGRTERRYRPIQPRGMRGTSAWFQRLPIQPRAA